MIQLFIVFTFFVVSVVLRHRSNRVMTAKKEEKNSSVEAWWARIDGELDVNEEAILFQRQRPVIDKYWTLLPNKFTAKDWELRLKEFSHLLKIFIEDTYVTPGKVRQRRIFYELWFLSMSYFTRVLSDYSQHHTHKLSNGKLCKLMAVCYWVAIKVTGHNMQLGSGDIVEMLDDMGAPEPVPDYKVLTYFTDMEKFVLKTLEWKVNDSTPFTFVQRLQLPEEQEGIVLKEALEIRVNPDHPDHTKSSFILVQRIVNKMV